MEVVIFFGGMLEFLFCWVSVKDLKEFVCFFGDRVGV